MEKKLFTFMALILIYLVLSSKTFTDELKIIYEYFNISPDNKIEEDIENVIKTKTGLDIELSPYNKM